MPERPLRETSRAVATSLSPSFAGLMKVMLPWAATARSLWLLQAKAKVESASVKMKPPCAMRWPFTMLALAVMVSVARPGPTSTISMPSAPELSSSFHIASAQARARSSGDSVAVALTFTCLLPERCRARWCEPHFHSAVWARSTKSVNARKVSHVVVIDHDPFRARPRLAGENKSRLQLPRLQRIVHFHLRLAFDQLGAAGRAHAALAGEWQVHAGAQRRIQNGLTLGDRHLAALAVDDQRGHRFWRRAGFDDSLRARFAAKFGDETFDMDFLVGNADGAAGRLDVLAHAHGTA